ncbi:hypothetical protein ACJZ2D_009691 [Fusarium nematophilum]
MIFSSRYQIDIPAVDVLTYVFGKTTLNVDSAPTVAVELIIGTATVASNLPVYVDAKDASQAISKRELETTVKKLAGGLRNLLNMEDGDVLLMFGENSIWYPAVVLGTICAGSVFTGANPAYTCAELVHQLTVSGAKYIFTDSQRLQTAIRAAESVGLDKDRIVLMPGKSESQKEGIRRMQDLLTRGTYAWEPIRDVEALAERVAVLNFSSGTTGLPKACMITHRNLVANSEQTLHLDRMARIRKSDPGFATNDVHCAYVPFYHAMGLLTYCIVNVRRCCSTVVMPRFDLKALLGCIQRFRVTYLLLVPPVVTALVKSDLVSQYDVSSVKFLICGAAPLQRELEVQLEAVFAQGKARSRQGWGMSEATMAVTLFGPDEFDLSHESVGYLVPNVQVKVMREDGVEVGHGQEGEALVRGPNVFKGYYKNPAATREAWAEDGWLKTGDIIKVGSSGLITIVDRKKELIKVKGFQVAPSELEGHLLQHQGVKDCAVIRVSRLNSNGQEHPQAHVVRTGPDVTAQSILAFMDKRLSAYKGLTGGIVFTDAIPKSASGKVLRRMLKDPDMCRPSRL